MAQHGLHDVQAPLDLYKNGVDETKYIEGTIKMIWMELDKPLEALVVIREHKFRVFFQLRKEYLDELRDLQPNDEFFLSLRGAKLQKLQSIPKFSTLSLQLLFSDGVELQWQRPDCNMRILNTWKGNFLHMLYFQISHNFARASERRE
jgi:hypothetical protein